MKEGASERVRVEVIADTTAAGQAVELAAGLAEEPPRIPSKYFYDDRGSRLFEAITTLPEYYLTRAEREILAARATEIAAIAGAVELVELGSGSAAKTRFLLDAMSGDGLRRYMPVDVSEAEIRRVAGELAAEYPALAIHGVVGDFLRLPRLPGRGPRLVAFLGSTIGNFRRDQAAAFLAALASRMAPGDHLLLGFDRVKEPARLEAAYNDAAGVTAEFNRNILRVVNARYAGDFDPQAFDHRAFYDAQADRIEMRLVARQPQVVRLDTLGLTLRFQPGDEILTEISSKYREEDVTALLEAAGLLPVRWFTDRRRDFGLVLARRP